jgi:hypothetical protein
LVTVHAAAAVRFSSEFGGQRPWRLEDTSVASLHLDEHSGKYHIRFYFGGVEYKRSLKTGDEKEALAVKGRVEETTDPPLVRFAFLLGSLSEKNAVLSDW